MAAEPVRPTPLTLALPLLLALPALWPPRVNPLRRQSPAGDADPTILI